MAKSGRAKRGNSSTNPTDLLVERPTTDQPRQPASGRAPQSQAGPEDKSFATIHTGDRAVYQSVLIASAATGAAGVAPVRAAPAPASHAGYPTTSPHRSEQGSGNPSDPTRSAR